MGKEVKWTPEAESTFESVIMYLERKWTEREIANFIEATNRIVEYISEHPKIFRKTNKRNIHEALVTPVYADVPSVKQNKLYSKKNTKAQILKAIKPR